MTAVWTGRSLNGESSAIIAHNEGQALGLGAEVYFDAARPGVLLDIRQRLGQHSRKGGAR